MIESGPHLDGPEPFRAQLEHVQPGSTAELKRFVGDNRYIVRVEPWYGDQDYPAFNKALLDFEKHSGLAVVPHVDVIGMATYDVENAPDIGEPAETGEYKATFHVAKRVDGIEAVQGDNLGNLNVPPEEVEKLLRGIVTYGQRASKANEPHIYEIRPNQFMYGTVEGDDVSRWYMVDLDYAFSDETHPSDITGIIGSCIGFLQEYTADEIFRPIAEEMLGFLRSPELMADVGQNVSAREYIEKLKWDLLDYLDKLDHL